MVLALRPVDGATHPNHTDAAHLAELLASEGTQPLRCVAVAPGHVALAVANGTYVHALSARDDAPDDDAPADPATGAPPAATTTTSTTSTTTVPSSHLSFHGASPVAALDFLPADAARNLPPVLLAVQEDGAVAAWCWVPAANDEEEAAGKNGGGGGGGGARRRKMRWAPMAAPAYAGGPPAILPPAPGLADERRVVRVAKAVAYEPERAGSNPTERNRNGNGNDDDLWGGCVVSLACLLGGGPRGAAPTLVVRRLRLGRRNVSGEKGVHRAKEEKEEEKEEALETLARYPGAVDVLTAGGRDFYVATETPEAEAEASEARGGEGKGSGSAGKRVVLYRWRSDARVATARVDLGRFAAAADEAARRAEVFRAEDGFSDDARKPFEDGSKNGARSSAADAARDPPREVGVVARLAAAVHFPSMEVAALTERGCVLRVGPALEASPFSLGGEGGAGGEGSASGSNGPGFDPDASSSPGSPGSHRPRLSARLVGTLDGFAAAFGSNSARRFGAFGSLVALGPFLHLAWFHDRGAASRRSRQGGAGAATSSRDATSADKNPPTSFSSDTLIDASDDARDWDVARWEPAAPPGKSAATSFHVRLGATLGTTPLPSLAPLRDEEAFGFGGEDTAGFDDAGHARGGRLDDDPAARYGSSRARAGPSVRLLDFGAAGHFLVAKDAGRAPAVFRAATRVPAAMASAARAVLRAAEEVKERLDEMKGDHSSEGGDDDGVDDIFTESGVASRARHAVAAIRATLRECAAFGGALERLEAALRLAAEELETALAARGVESGGDVSGGANDRGGGGDDRGDWDRAATAALLLLDRPPPGTRAEATWMKAAAAEATRREASVKSFDAFADEPKNHRSFDRGPGGSSGAGAGSAASIVLLRAASAGAGGRLGADASDASPYASDASDAAAAARGGDGVSSLFDAAADLSRALSEPPRGGAGEPDAAALTIELASRARRVLAKLERAIRSGRRVSLAEEESGPGDGDPARALAALERFLLPGDFRGGASGEGSHAARSGAASDPSGEALDVAAGLLARAVADAEEEEARRARESESRERREKTTTKKTLATRPFEAACAALRVAWPRGVPELTLRVAALVQEDREEEEAERAEEEEAGNRSSSSSSAAAAVRRFRRSRRVVRGGPGPAARVTRRFSSRLRHFARRALSALVPRHRSAESAESLAALGATLAMAGREHAAAWLLLLLRAAASDDDDERRQSDASDARTPSGGDFEPNRTDLRTTTTRDDDDARDAMDAMIALTVEDDDPGGGGAEAREDAEDDDSAAAAAADVVDDASRGASRDLERSTSGSARPTCRGFELATRLLRAEAGRGDARGYRGASRTFEAIAGGFFHAAARRASAGAKKKSLSKTTQETSSKTQEASSEEADDEEDEEDEDEDAEGPSMRFSVASAAWYLLSSADALAASARRRARGDVFVGASGLLADDPSASSADPADAVAVSAARAEERAREKAREALLVRGGGIGNRDSAAAGGDDSRGSIARRGLGVGALERLAAASAGCLARLTALVDADGPGRG